MSFQPNKLSKRDRTEENLLSVLYLFCKNGAIGAAVSTVQGLGDQGSGSRLFNGQVPQQHPASNSESSQNRSLRRTNK